MNRKEEIISELKKNYKPVKSGKTFTIDVFRPEDAMGVIGCCYSIYGDGYPVDTYYIPEKLIEANRNGTIYGIVAKTSDGEVIGYCAIYKSSAQYEKLYEMGQYIIQKEYQGSRAAYYLNAKVVAYSKEIGLDAAYGECVTNHIITQKFGDRAGCYSTAIEIDLMPSEAYKNVEMVKGRVSCLFQFLIHKDREQVLFIPEYYKDRLEETIKSMPLIKREIKTISSGKEKKETSRLLNEQFDFAGVSRLNVLEVGKDFDNKIEELENIIKGKNYKVSQVFISLADSNAIEIIEMLNGKGYFYGGYLPRWLDNDALLMQKLYVQPTFEGIQLYPKGTIGLLEFIKHDYEKFGNLI